MRKLITGTVIGILFCTMLHGYALTRRLYIAAGEGGLEI